MPKAVGPRSADVAVRHIRRGAYKARGIGGAEERRSGGDGTQAGEKSLGRLARHIEKCAIA